MVNVDDAARAFAALVSHPEARGVYNVSGENGITSKEVAEIIAARVGCKTESVTLDEAKGLFGPAIAGLTSKNNQVDNSKTQSELSWKPQHTDFRGTF